MTNATAQTQPEIAALPPVLDLRALQANFAICRTTAYSLASSGEIQSLTLGAPGKRGKRVFLTQSVLDFIERRTATAKPLNCLGNKTTKLPPVTVTWALNEH